MKVMKVMLKGKQILKQGSKTKNKERQRWHFWITHFHVSISIIKRWKLIHINMKKGKKKEKWYKQSWVK
jgi:hypothetical protein